MIDGWMRGDAAQSAREAVIGGVVQQDSFKGTVADKTPLSPGC